MSSCKVQILLSTYNGAEYIDEQIESILSQEVVDFQLLIRDDGSSDQTISKLRQYVTEYPGQVNLSEGVNLGAKDSYFELIQMCSVDFDFYAFCDQDDVWNGKKLMHAITVLKDRPQDIPVMYCSSTAMVDSDLKFIQNWPETPRRPLSLYNALVENIAVGCTIVMNRKAMDFVKASLPINKANVIMHDWWLYLCISAFGEVIFDSDTFILYRQHNNNVIGGPSSNYINKWTRRLKRFIRGKNSFILSKQAAEFLSVFHNKLDIVRRKHIKEFLVSKRKSLIKRYIYTVRTPFYRQDFTDNIVLKILYIFGRV